VKNYFQIRSINSLIIGFIFLLLFLLPVVFTRVNGDIAWNYVVKIWKDQMLLIPLFAINHWLLVPKLMLGKKYVTYLFCVFAMVAVFSSIYYYSDEVLHKKPKNHEDLEQNRPDPVPPYANLLMYSLLIVGVDSGLSFSKKWQENEEKKQQLENENTKIQLDILRNQISPHFFMNTMNNIYGLIDINTTNAKESVMKLSKLMRYMLYENVNGKVKLSKEFDFIKSYTDLMRVRSAENLVIKFTTPETFEDVEIPSMLFISYVENAFKYGVSSQRECRVGIEFSIQNNRLQFTCNNSKNRDFKIQENGGLGLRNSESRLKLLFGNTYTLEIDSFDNLYNVSLIIPLV
jgi:hypothetical protein